MFTTEDYLYGWLLYIASGLVFFACWWYLTARLASAGLRLVLRVLALVIMFTPWYAEPGMDYLAPAVLIAGVEGIFDGAGSFWRAGTPLLVATGIALAIAIAVALFRHRARGSRPTPDSEAA